MKPISRNFAFPILAAALVSPLHAALIHQYKFDETTGTVAADFVGTANGTIGANVVLGQPSLLGKSFLFPAAATNAGSRVTLPNTVTPGAVFTMTAFYNFAVPLASGQQVNIVSGNNSAAGRWSIGIYDKAGTPTLLWFLNGGVNLEKSITTVAGTWVHVGVTRDATGLTQLYLNGVSVASGTSTAPLVTTPIGIGEVPTGTAFQFNGRIDQVRFYDNALTASEMATVAAETDDSDMDGLPDAWEIQHFGNLSQNGDGDPDGDGFSNRIEYLAGTDPNDANSFPKGDSDNDGMDDGWEYLHFGNLSRDGTGDFDGDGSLDLEEYQASQGIHIVRNPDGSVASVSTFTGSSDPTDPNSQPDQDSDGLPDGFEFRYFGDNSQNANGDFDGDGYSNMAEFLAGSNPARKSNTPANVHVTTRVAVTDNTGIEEYSVTDRVWTFVTQGWNTSSAQEVEIGPDGKVYFTTSFGSAAGEGVFRVNKDGTNFEHFIARTGGTPPNNWILNNSRGIEWVGNDFYVSARNSNAIYKFDTSGAFVSNFASVTGTQGLTFDEGSLLSTSNINGSTSLLLMDLTLTPPVTASSVTDATTPSGLNTIDLNGDIYSVTYGSGGTVGQIVRHATELPFTHSVVVNALPSLGNDLRIFTSSLVSDPYIAWATGKGLDPNSPNGARTGDFDGDGTTNEVEFALGLDPKNGTSRFAVTVNGTPSAGQTLTWPSQPGITFEVRSSTDLVDWTTVEATVIGQAAMNSASFTLPAAAGPRKFYRVQFVH